MSRSHRSQKGPFHIVQIVKKRDNSNCKYYLNGKCTKKTTVCGIHDDCKTFEAKYIKRNSNKKEYNTDEEKTLRKTYKDIPCQHYDGLGYCKYLEKKCSSANNCISFRQKEHQEVKPIKKYKPAFECVRIFVYTYRSGKVFQDFGILLDNKYNHYFGDGFARAFPHGGRTKRRNIFTRLYCEG